MCPEQILAETMKNLDRLMKSPGARKRPIVIQSVEDVVAAAHNFHGGKYEHSFLRRNWIVIFQSVPNFPNFERCRNEFAAFEAVFEYCAAA